MNRLTRKIIVLAEDEIFLRKTVKASLELEGAHVLDAPDGKAAWDLIQANKVDIVVSDFKMPVINGLELLQLIREANLKTPFIFITGFAGETYQNMLDAGAYSILTKPFDSNKLVEDMVAALNEATSRQRKVI